MSAFAVRNSDLESISSEKISTSPSVIPASRNPSRMAYVDTPWIEFMNASTPCR